MGTVCSARWTKTPRRPLKEVRDQPDEPRSSPTGILLLKPIGSQRKLKNSVWHPGLETYLDFRMRQFSVSKRFSDPQAEKQKKLHVEKLNKLIAAIKSIATSLMTLVDSLTRLSDDINAAEHLCPRVYTDLDALHAQHQRWLSLLLPCTCHMSWWEWIRQQPWWYQSLLLLT